MRRRRAGRGDGRRAAGLTPDRPTAELAVRVRARSGRDEIVGERDGRILVRVGAPPVQGRANRAVCRAIAKRARVPRGAVRVVRGQRSRDKAVLVEGLTEAELRRRLAT